MIAEFGGNGVVATLEDKPAGVCFVPFEVQRSPLSSAEWGRRLWTKAAKLRAGKAAGPHLLPPELLRCGGQNCMAVLGCVAEAAASMEPRFAGNGDGWLPLPRSRLP